MFCPAKAKLNINKYSPYDNTLYIDTTSLVTKDIEPAIDMLISKRKFLYSIFLERIGINDAIHYQVWVENQQLWDFSN